MKVVQIEGNLSGDRVSDIYPTIAVCDECYEDISYTIHEEEYSDMYGDCAFCSKSKEQEDEDYS